MRLELDEIVKQFTLYAEENESKECSFMIKFKDGREFSQRVSFPHKTGKEVLNDGKE